MSKKNIISRLNIFLTLVILSIVIDNISYKCHTPNIYSFTNNFLHHTFSMYLWFGSFIFGNHLIHLIVISLVIFFQYFNEWNCVVTLKYNELCNFNKDESHKDLMYFFTKLFPTEYPYYTLITLLVLFDMYYIVQK